MSSPIKRNTIYATNMAYDLRSDNGWDFAKHVIENSSERYYKELAIRQCIESRIGALINEIDPFLPARDRNRLMVCTIYLLPSGTLDRMRLEMSVDWAGDATLRSVAKRVAMVKEYITNKKRVGDCHLLGVPNELMLWDHDE